MDWIFCDCVIKMQNYFKRVAGPRPSGEEPPGKRARSVPSPAEVPSPAKTYPETRRRYEANRPRNFLPQWETQYPWVDFKDGEMFCRVCRAYPSLAKTSSTLFKGVTGKVRSETLKYHHRAKEHVRCEVREANERNPAEVPLRKMVKKLNKDSEARMKVLFKTAFYIAKEKDAFNKFTSRLDYAESLGVDVGEMYRNDKSCRIFVDSIAAVEEADVASEVAKARFITVLADGSTNCGMIEQESVYVRFVDEHGLAQTKLAGMITLEAADAPGVLQGIIKGLQYIGIDEEVLRKKLVCCNFDGAAVMLGHKSGDAVRMQEMVAS